MSLVAPREGSPQGMQERSEARTPWRRDKIGQRVEAENSLNSRRCANAAP